jgi:hypothetical protein
MYTASCALALHFLLGTLSPAPAWHGDYRLALQRAEAAKKPVAVFIGSGKNGWNALCEEGTLNAEARRLLTEHYVAVYIDVSQPNQKEVTQSFEADKLPLLVLSTHDRRYQAYRHPGTLGNDRLAKALEHYATAQAEPAPAEQPTYAASSAPVYPVQYSVPCRT